MAGRDGFAGTWEVNPGVTRPFQLDFSDLIAPYDAVHSIISTSIFVSPKSKVADPNAAACAIGTPTLTGNIVSQIAGGMPPAGFQGGVLYVFGVYVLTNMGSNFYGYAHIFCKDPL
jgi:hypothetical protein